MVNPNINADGDKFWRNEQDQYHREDGPAIEWCDGYKDWFLNDIRYTEEEFRMIQFMKGIKVNDV